ncbi:hypothetical protein J0910_21550 [Nocardiopsis sp. CNT-189]|uniref:hypothetical protein n=1 Tax=Nocardiopsis oceanisediminis TaxID=2816862 RepID=UPI003B33EFB4
MRAGSDFAAFAAAVRAGDPDACAAAFRGALRETADPPEDGEVAVRGAWTLHGAEGAWITGSRRPASLPGPDGERAVALAPLSVHAQWCAGRAFPMVRADPGVLAEPPAGESRSRPDRAAPARPV